MSLSIKQEAFCQEYVKSGNATAAYFNAGYAVKSPKAAAVEGAKLLKTPNIQARIAELQASRSTRTQIESDKVLKEIARLAFAQVTDVVKFNNEDLEIKDSDTLNEDTKAAIHKISITKDKFGAIKKSVEMHDKKGALALLMKYLGLDSDFNSAIATLRKYGLVVYQENGAWSIREES